ncbi:Casein kinase I isoform delta-like protein [Grifola frondosa]|uniref:Casein kinase I isoform delta-like protein n=1 Tax=Grifola frondosa TaxID=5627 RepID=A0A1C7M2Z3_GRIFR|nr:Casein kinase I isoform delta-like protein [Grifola frondosa]
MSHHKYPERIGTYWLGENLGSGFSGSIFRATSLYNNQVVALKIQDVNAECPTNRYERNFYPMLQGGIGMPTLWACGEDGPWDYLAIDLLGPSLDSLFRRSRKEIMDLRSVCCIAMQVPCAVQIFCFIFVYHKISRLEFMHSRGILHRDIQLGNCVIGLPPNDKIIYMIDFGFSKCYIDPQTGRHIPDSDKKRDFIGNYWFSSVRVHCRGKGQLPEVTTTRVLNKDHIFIVPSRRDDLEAVALMLIHLLTPGGLSWTRNGVPKTDEAHERLMREKRRARPEDLCRGLPSEFEEFLRYCRKLNFEQCPDYHKWIEEFRALAVEHGYPERSDFIWPPPVSQPTARVAVHPRRPQGMTADEMEAILGGIANLQLGERQVLGNRNEVANGVRSPTNHATKPVPQKPPTPSNDAIVISSDDENAPGKAPAAVRLPKAAHLMKLARATSEATENVALARIVQDFVGVLQETRSRTLTKEGFAVLDALYKQLADPSVYVIPLRTSRPRRSRSQEEEQAPEPRHVKMNKLFGLRRDVAKARNNEDMAKMVADFGVVIDRSAGRTITKDGFGFLEGLAARLRATS